MKQLLFEWKKIVTEKTNYFGAAMVIILLILPILFLSSEKKEIENQQVDMYQAILEISSQAEKNMTRIPEAAEQLVKVKESSRLMENLISDYQSGTETEKLVAEYQYEKNQLRDLEDGSLIGASVIEQQKKVSTLEQLLQKNISKVYDTQKSIPTFNYLSQFFKGLIPSTLILIIFSLLFANIYSFEKRKNTNSFFHVIPKSLNLLAINKIGIATLFVLMTFLIPLLLVFFFLLFKNGLGDPNYPMAYSPDGIEVSIMTAKVFITKSVILLLFYLLFLSMFSFFISLLTGSVLVNAGLLVAMITLGDSPIFKAEPFSNFSHFSPFSYVNMNDVLLRGNVWEPLSNPSLTFSNGILCLTIYIVIIFITSFSLMSAKDNM